MPAARRRIRRGPSERWLSLRGSQSARSAKEMDVQGRDCAGEQGWDERPLKGVQSGVGQEKARHISSTQHPPPTHLRPHVVKGGVRSDDPHPSREGALRAVGRTERRPLARDIAGGAEGCERGAEAHCLGGAAGEREVRATAPRASRRINAIGGRQRRRVNDL